VNLFEGRLRAELEVEYYGKRFGDNGNTQIIPDYYLLNAHVRFNLTDHLSLYAYGENLSNEIGLTERNPRAGQFIATDSNSEFYIGRPELGRSFRAAVLYRF
jgi:outer membrane receptor protein involved in Fe transport